MVSEITWVKSTAENNKRSPKYPQLHQKLQSTSTHCICIRGGKSRNKKGYSKTRRRRTEYSKTAQTQPRLCCDWWLPISSLSFNHRTWLWLWWRPQENHTPNSIISRHSISEKAFCMVPEMNNGEFPFDLEESRTITGAPFRRNQTSSSNGTMFVFVVPESSPDIHGDDCVRSASSMNSQRAGEKTIINNKLTLQLWANRRPTCFGSDPRRPLIHPSNTARRRSVQGHACIWCLHRRVHWRPGSLREVKRSCGVPTPIRKEGCDGGRVSAFSFLSFFLAFEVKQVKPGWPQANLFSVSNVCVRACMQAQELMHDIISSSQSDITVTTMSSSSIITDVVAGYLILISLDAILVRLLWRRWCPAWVRSKGRVDLIEPAPTLPAFYLLDGPVFRLFFCCLNTLIIIRTIQGC